MTGNGRGNEVCHFCGEDGHISTNGPEGTSLVQYFTCKKFAELNPAQRFRELRTKGFCCQCLYPGAKQSTGKHAAGKCQCDFVCTHTNHDKYPVKKHVLVCQEHCTSEDNQRVLGEYKSRCILRQRYQTIISSIYINKERKKKKNIQMMMILLLMMEYTYFKPFQLIIRVTPYFLIQDAVILSVDTRLLRK